MKKAFTLAEVLITMTIIGVIAVLTIPNLMGNANNKAMKTKFKASYTSLQKGFELANSDNNPVVKWKQDNLDSNITKYFKAKNTGLSNESISIVVDNISPTFNTKIKYRLGNGAYIIFPGSTVEIMDDSGCTKEDDFRNMCVVFLDINGAAGPNETLMCTSGTTSTTLSASCTVDENKISDIYPLVLTDKTIKPLTNAVQSILDE